MNAAEVHQPVNFRTPANYGMLTPGESLTFENKQLSRVFELPTLIIPTGSIVYRADAGGAKSPSNAVPAFFSNDESITVYKRGKEENVSKYRTTRNVRLFVMTVPSLRLLSTFYPELTPEDKSYFKTYLQKHAENAVLPIFPTRDQHGYLNRAIAAILCRLGVDGWIVQPYEKGKTGMRNYSLMRPMADYKPEFMVCKWTDCMERILEGGRVGTRRLLHKQKRKRTRVRARIYGGAQLPTKINITDTQLRKLMKMHFEYTDPVNDSMMILDPTQPQWITQRDINTLEILVGDTVTVDKVSEIVPYPYQKNYFYLFPARKQVEIWMESRM